MVTSVRFATGNKYGRQESNLILLRWNESIINHQSMMSCIYNFLFFVVVVYIDGSFFLLARA
jgi:hypothetical protein